MEWGIVQVGYCPVGNCPVGNCPWGIVRVGNCPGFTLIVSYICMYVYIYIYIYASNLLRVEILSTYLLYHIYMHPIFYVLTH